MNPGAARWIRRLGLKRHPEGGYYRETYRSRETIAVRALPRRFAGRRCFATAIFFLLEGRDVSRLHRIRSDELWHYHAGGPLLLHLLSPAGQRRTLRLGPGRGETLQAVVPAGTWCGAHPLRPRSYTLVGCTVAPGFDFADFELAGRRRLLAGFPRHAPLIRRLTS